MKRTKRIFAIFMTLALAMSMLIVSSAVSFAAEGDGYTVTINGNEQDKGEHTYGAYQIFTGTIGANGDLGNIAWGSGITAAGKTALGDAKTYAESMTDANAAEKAAQLAQYLADPEATGSDEITGLEGGYYLIQDENGSPVSDTDQTKPAAKTKFILKVLSDEEVTVKSSVPTVEKKVQDDGETTWQDSADYNIGDSIPYKVTGTIGTGIANFSSYSFQFVDTMSKGLTLDESSWDIKVGDKSIKSLFQLTSVAGQNGATVWTWAATDIKPEIADGSKVVLTYNCTLNSDAVIGSAGNPNTVILKFDNNPNNSGQGTPEGETPEDKNIVFTYKTVFNKVKADGTTALTGADFKLEKKVGNNWVDVTTLHSGDGAVNPTKDGDSTGSTFTFKGLDDGEYRLTETTTPSGYNTIDPIVFTITAEHSNDPETLALTSLTGTDGGEFTMTPVLSEGSLTGSVVNEQGSTLPSTGGIGTVIFYVLGSLLVVGCGIVLISKKRMESR